MKEISENIFIPITVGGGIKDLDDIKNLLNCGADRISINTKALAEPDFIRKINEIYGNQFLTVSVEVRNINGLFYCMSNHGRDNSNYQLKDWLDILDKYKIGEVIITSIDLDGSCLGFDKELISEISNHKYNFPIVYGGGLGEINHVEELLKIYNFSGVSIAAGFHNNKIDIKNLKKFT